MARMRTIATGLLVVMAVVFILSSWLEPRFGALSFVSAFAEAAMIGALADWFAVTALFRRPLNLPIPHTAIIPNNKDRIGESVADFLENNFMTQEVLNEELRHIDFAGSSANWLANAQNRHAVSVQIASGVPAVFRMVNDEDIGSFIQQTLGKTLQSVKAAPMLAELLSILVVDRRHQALFDRLIVMASKALEENRPFIRQKIHEKSPRWIPKVIDEKLFERLLEETQAILEEMMDEDSEWRMRFQAAAEDLIEKLRSSPEYEEKINSIVRQALTHPQFLSYSKQVWRDVEQRLLRDIESDNSQTVAQLDNALRAFADALLQDMTVREKLNHWIREFAAEAISKRRRDIASLVNRVIKKWDAETVSRKFELYVGKDLQYIRINGTLVGGLVGLILHSVTLALRT